MRFRCPQVAVSGKEEERWRGKDEGALFKRWRRTTAPAEPTTTPAPAQTPAQPSELLKFLAIVSMVIFHELFFSPFCHIFNLYLFVNILNYFLFSEVQIAVKVNLTHSIFIEFHQYLNKCPNYLLIHILKI